MIPLQAGDWTATLRPDLGGALLDLDWRSTPVLRPTPDGTDEILQTACFPLVPFANRIADGRFRFGGRDVVLPALEQFAPHALHGEGWLRPWAVDSADARCAVLSLSGGGDAWPWPWTAIQTVTLSDDGLRIDLAMTSTADEPAPAGLGLHPYFHRTPNARLILAAVGVWLTDAREIPERLAPPADLIDWSRGEVVADAPFVDHAYAGWSGSARLEGGGRTVMLQASDNARWAQVYAPEGEPFVCIEPVTHRPDAIHAPAGEVSGLTVLEPGDTLAVSMTIAIEGNIHDR